MFWGPLFFAVVESASTCIACGRRNTEHAYGRSSSVCSGALILGAAGILKGRPATTHWYKMGVLRIMGAKPQPDDRIVRSGKIVTAAGVSASIDLALWLAGRSQAPSRPAIQLFIEYDQHPPFGAGHMSKASKETQKLAKEMTDRRMPADQRRLVPKIAWKRFIDLIRTGKIATTKTLAFCYGIGQFP